MDLYHILVSFVIDIHATREVCNELTTNKTYKHVIGTFLTVSMWWDLIPHKI